MRKHNTAGSFAGFIVAAAVIAWLTLGNPGVARGQTPDSGAYTEQRGAADLSQSALSTADTPKTAVKASGQLLNDDEVAQLQAREQQPGLEVNGGALSNEHLTYIVIALAAAVLVLVLV